MPYILEGVGCGADYESRSENLPGINGRHVVFAQMHTVGTKEHGGLHAVIDYECRAIAPAYCECFSAGFDIFVFRDFFHAELHPAASAA